MGLNKAAALAARLNESYFPAKVEGHPHAFPPNDNTMLEKVAGADIVVDCTAEDYVLTQLEQFDWSGEKVFAVLSLGWQARTFHCYTRRSSIFLAKAYSKRLNPILTEEQRRRSKCALSGSKGRLRVQNLCF